MDITPPDRTIIKGFQLSGEPSPLSGGQGTSFRVGSAVLKHVDSIEEASWIAEVNKNLVSSTFRVPKPIPSKDGSWVVDGWAADEFVDGVHKTGNYAEAIQVSKEFHQSLIGIVKPAFFETRNNVWAIADRMAWGEQSFPDFALTNDYFQHVSTLLTKNKLPSQLIHGDWGLGNIIFDQNNTPVIIDFSPYWRPAGFAIAIMIVDALAYESADPSIVTLCATIKEFDQLLIRAFTRRICEYIGHQNHPENTQDRTNDIQIHLNLFTTLFQKNY